MPKRYVGIDLGGTNLKLGLVAPDGRVLMSHASPTEAAGGPQHVLDRMAGAVVELCEKAGLRLSDIAAVGVGSPGPVDTKRGVVVFAPNMAGWRNIPVSAVLRKKLRRPVRLENDANIAAYGEFRCGAARHVRDMFLLTLGTGIGGGIVLDGRLFRGVSDTGAELGHVVVQNGGRACGCGNRGCLEAYASATGVVGRFRAESATLDGKMDFTCEDIFVAADGGNRIAGRIVEETAEYLGIGITSLLHVLNPSMVVLTGGMMGAGKPFLDRVRRVVRERAFQGASAACEICWSTLGGDAGIIGAALAAEALDRTGKPA
jgi:glucokinase